MKRAWFLSALLLLAGCSPLAAREFGPWDADVSVGDRALEGQAHADVDRQVALRGIYDSFTGGALLLIRAFQIWISPQDGPSCRFHPTCSAYGTIAVRKHGAFLGSVLAGDRILRCNIFSKPGEDPVPDHLMWHGR
jgi:uncharacterized protein